MTLYVRLKSPHITLQRRKKSYPFIMGPQLHKWGLLPLLTVMFLSIAFACIGFFITTEMKLVQKYQVENKYFASNQQRAIESIPSINIPREKKTFSNYKKIVPIQKTLEDFKYVTHKEDSKLLTLARKSNSFKINPLLNKNAPSVELSAQITLNRLYGENIKRDIINYYNATRCKELIIKKSNKSNIPCKTFSLANKSTEKINWWSNRPCPLYPSNLVKKKEINKDEILSINKLDHQVLVNIRPGGWYEPKTCFSRHSVAIIIPYKDRWKHLTTLLNHLHPLLQKQQLRYKMFVVEQYGNETFNKGIIMNAGFLEALKEELFYCFIFHDVDLIPENELNMYTCPDMPRHLSVAVNEFQYKLPYPELVGGALAIRTDHFFKVNGYSNFYWGWGGEDDDMGTRILQSGLHIIRPNSQIARYTMIKHVKRKPSDTHIRHRLLRTTNKRYRLEGLNSVEYKLIKKKEFPWFTTLMIEIGKPHPSFYLNKQN